MKKIVIILLALMIAPNVIGQVHLGINKSDIKISYLDNFPKEFENSTSYFTENDDYLKVTMDGYGKIESTYFFNTDEICDSILIQYYCSECVIDQLKDILEGKRDTWVKINEDMYLTKNKYSHYTKSSKGNIGCGMLKISRTPKEVICTTLQISMVEYEKKTWKKLIQKAYY